MRADVFRTPTDHEITDAENRLGATFPKSYREFLKDGGNVANAKFEAAVVLPDSGHLDIFAITEAAWNMGLPRTRVPFVEDNGDYYCLAPDGSIEYWSHNGPENEKWPTFDDWFQQVCVELR